MAVIFVLYEKEIRERGLIGIQPHLEPNLEVGCASVSCVYRGSGKVSDVLQPLGDRLQCVPTVCMAEFMFTKG